MMLTPNDYFPKVYCAKCGYPRAVDRLDRLARADGDIEYVVECHGQRKRLRFAAPLPGVDPSGWYERVLRDLNDAFKPPPQFRIRTRPHVRRASTEAR